MRTLSKLGIAAALMFIASPALADVDVDVHDENRPTATIEVPARTDNLGTLGVGLGAGTTANGLSVKYFASDVFALQATLGTSAAGPVQDRYTQYGGLGASVDGLIENRRIAENDFVALGWNFGAGAGVSYVNKNFGTSVAGVVGAELNFVKVPVDLVLEYRPTLAVVPDVRFEPLNFTGHLRYYFR